MAEYEAMTEREIDAAVEGRVVGWTIVPSSQRVCSPDEMPLDLVRHYSTDCTEASNVESEIERKGLVREYIEALVSMVTGRDGCECEDESGACAQCWFAVAHATPKERCLAALRAIDHQEGSE